MDEAGGPVGFLLAVRVERVGGDGDRAVPTSNFTLDFGPGFWLGSDSWENCFEVGGLSRMLGLDSLLLKSSGRGRLEVLVSVKFLDDHESSVAGLDRPILAEAHGADVLSVRFKDVVDNVLVFFDLHLKVLSF